MRKLKRKWNFLYRLAIFMSVYGLYLSNSLTDSNLLLLMKRPYIGTVQRGVIFFFLKIGKWNTLNVDRIIQLWVNLMVLASLKLIFMCFKYFWNLKYCSFPIYVYWLEHIKLWGIKHQRNNNYLEPCVTGVNIFDYLTMGQWANIEQWQTINGEIKGVTLHLDV